MLRIKTLMLGLLTLLGLFGGAISSGQWPP
jgi:hypothetical protein